VRELIWREFSYYSLYHFPHLCQENIKSQFNRFPWAADETNLLLWQKGQTGFPLIDAGMRELWQTGYMHNRVRMIVGSFLVKNLMIHWLEGARWFWDCLVDADLANNSCSWQWVAGSGADAAPYFRIFNPVTQSQRFDPQGSYIRKYVPELAGLSNKAIHDPSSLSQEELQQAGVTLGENYPRAIVDLKESRVRALDAYKSLADQG
jgi:deoxyribodipyrimidine photo-lyase